MEHVYVYLHIYARHDGEKRGGGRERKRIEREHDYEEVGRGIQEGFEGKKAREIKL